MFPFFFLCFLCCGHMHIQPPASRVASQPATLCAGQQAMADKGFPPRPPSALKEAVFQEPLLKAVSILLNEGKIVFKKVKYSSGPLIRNFI